MLLRILGDFLLENLATPDRQRRNIETSELFLVSSIFLEDN